ncbi:MAG: hypothetical protein JW927_20565 [Deltaproteobacteria bacterium]|nr:hypothetical protein [Deltaproteobacteria bacterium]
MESQKKIEKNEEIMVLDNGQNMDDPMIIMIAFCCYAFIIPIRILP